MNIRIVCALLCGAVFLLISSPPALRAQGAPQFDISWSVIGSAGAQSRNGCFILNGTAGQAAPGYSSGGVFAVASGFWPALPTTGQDEIFFTGFERCSP